jgi:uncharacterized repeat protein (TIGR02543 family)
MVSVLMALMMIAMLILPTSAMADEEDSGTLPQTSGTEVTDDNDSPGDAVSDEDADENTNEDTENEDVLNTDAEEDIFAEEEIIIEKIDEEAGDELEALDTPTIENLGLTYFKRDGAPFDVGAGADYLWDYVTDFDYSTVVEFSVIGVGINRKVIVTAPEGMRFLQPNNDVLTAGISVALSPASGADTGKIATITVADNVGDSATVTPRIGIATQVAALNTFPYGTTAQQAVALNVGNSIKTAAQGGALARPLFTAVGVISEGGVEGAASFSTAVPMAYESGDIFDGFFFYTLGNGNPGQGGKQPDMRINVYREIGQTSIYGVFEPDRYFYLDNLVIHDPYWDLALKIYLPDGITTGRDDLTVYPDAGDGLGEYILYSDINQDPLNQTWLNREISPLIDKVFVTSSGANPNPNNGGTAWAVFGDDLDLQLKATETLTSEKVYNLKTVASFTTFDGNHQQIFDYQIKTDKFVSADKYAIEVPSKGYSDPWSRTFDLPQGRDLDTLDYFEYFQIRSNTTDMNNPHIGGTLTVEPGEGYEIYSVKMAQATAATYYMDGDGAGYSATKDGENFVFDAAGADAVTSGRVVKIVFELGAGIILKTNGTIPVSFGMRTLLDATEDVVNTKVAVTLRDADDADTALDGCTEYNTNDQIYNPANGTHNNGQNIYEGQHKVTFPVTLRKPVDDLIVQTYGGNQRGTSGESPRIIPFLADTGAQATETSAHIAFGYQSGTGNDLKGQWPVYSDFSMDITGERALSTFSGSIELNKYLAYTNARFVYTTNKGSGQTTPVSSGTPGIVESGAAQTVEIPLDCSDPLDPEYLTSLRFEADMFAALAVKYHRTYTVTFADTYWGWVDGGARINFYSRDVREFPDGTPIRDYRDADSSYAFDVHYNATEITESAGRASEALTPVPVCFALYRSGVIHVSESSHSRSMMQGSVTLSQGAQYSFYIYNPLSKDAQVALIDRTVWLKVNPYFVYVGDDPNIRQVKLAGSTYLIIGEKTPFNVSQYTPATIKMMALPSTPVGQHYVFEKGWSDFSGTFDFDYVSTHAPYVVPFFSNEAWTEDDPLDINGDGRTDNVLLTMFNQPTTITLNLSSGVTLIPGVDSILNPVDKIAPFHEDETDALTGYIAIGGSDKVLTDYVTTLHLPQKGEAVGDKGNTDFGLKLKGALYDDDSLTALNAVIEYKKNGNYTNTGDTAAWTVSDWNAVTDIRITISTMPANLTVGTRLNLQVPSSEVKGLDHLGETYLVAVYKHSSIAGSNSNTTTYKFLRNNSTVRYFANYNIEAEENVIGDDGEYLTLQETLPYDTAATEPGTDPGRDSHVFRGWYTEAECETAWEFADHVTGNTDLYAKWERLYKVNFAADAHGILDSGDVADYSDIFVDTLWSDALITAPATIPDEDYFFLGWYKNGARIDITSEAYGTHAITSDELYTARFGTSYTVTYAPGSTDVTGLPGGVTVKEGTPYSVSAALPVKTGHSFTNWTASFGGKYQGGNTFTMPAANVVLTAQWTPDDDGGGGGGGEDPLPPDPPDINPPVIVTPNVDPPTPPTPPVPPTPTPEEPTASTATLNIHEPTASLIEMYEEAGIPILSIGPLDIPLTGLKGEHYWALVNLILAIAGLVLAAIAIVRMIRRKTRRDEEIMEYGQEQKTPARIKWLLPEIIVAIVAVIAFLLTEDLRAIMVLVDIWTILMAILFAAVIVFNRLAFRMKQDEDDEDGKDEEVNAFEAIAF